MTEATEHDIRRLGHLGDGIADGPVYAARTLPGERVSGRLDGNRLENVRIATPSDDRVRPACPHYASCGGCDLQHASDAFVSRWKQDLVRSALAEQGLAASFRPLVTSPEGSRRRAVFSARKTKCGALAGFHGRRSDMTTSVPNCTVLHPDLTAFLPTAEMLAKFGASRKQALAISVTQSENGLDVSVENGKPLDESTLLALAGIARNKRIARLVWSGETIVVLGQPVQSFDGLRVVPPPGAFLQATKHGEETLLAGVREITSGSRRTLDLFAGCGTFSLPLARFSAVHAVEGDAAMLESAAQAWKTTSGLKRFTTTVRDLFRDPVSAQDINSFDAVVIDPPRAGAEAQARAISCSEIRRVAYVSCNPITFARDARILTAAGFGLDWVQVVDQFRWSTHTELVASLRR